MYKDIISYEIAENVTKEHLLRIAEQIVNEWMKNLPGFLSWEIHENVDGTFSDVVNWQSEENAKHAEKEMVNIPNAGEWYACYKPGSITTKKLHQIAKF
ncbi:MAG: hypothetical protein MRY83_00120 [Flavobacteriales bacterium]|nr:hypothetical protein [Flavobacteriales bacterium]